MYFTFLFTVLFVGQAFLWVTRRQRKLEDRLKQSLSLKAVKMGHQNLISDKKVRDHGKFIKLPGIHLSKKYTRKMQNKLVKAGVPLKPEELVSFSVISGLASTVIGMIIFKNFFVSVAVGIVGLSAPFLWINSMTRRRMVSFESQLLNALVVLANSLRGGYSFMQGLELISRETAPPLSKEFEQVVRETKIGIPLEESLAGLCTRVDSKDLELVVTALLIQRQVGGNLAVVLDTVANTIEKRIKMKGKIRTLTAQGRMTAWIITILPFALATMVFGRYPEYGQLMISEPAGVAMIAGGLLMLILGIAVIRKVVNIDV